MEVSVFWGWITIRELFKVLLNITFFTLLWRRNQCRVKICQKCINTVWFVTLAIEIGIVCFSTLKVFNRPIARSTWIQRDAIFLPCSTSAAGSWWRPSRNGGILRSMFSSFSMFFIVNPLSAIIDMAGLSARVSRIPHVRVSLTSDMDPTYTGDI